MALPTETPNLVTPAWQTCQLKGIASFKPGVWNGVPHSAAFVRAIKANFDKYSSGAEPYYVPYVSINHNDQLQAGRVSACEMDGDTLTLDAVDVPEPVGQWRNAGGIRQPSIEYFEPKYDVSGKLVDGFRKPDGSIEPGPVLKCLTLLGADAPAVKGLPDLPFAQFNHRPANPQNPGRGARVRKFANEDSTMDRAAMIAALQGAGIDTAWITDAIPDEALKALVDAWQKLNANPSATTAADPTVQAMADATTGAATVTQTPTPAVSAPGVQVPGVGGLGNAQPSQVVLRFADATPAGIAAGIAPALAAIQNQANAMIAAIAANGQRNLAAVNHAAAQQAHSAKFSDVTNFVNALAKPDAQGFARITPVQKPHYVTLLMKCDAVQVRRFADGKGSGSELDEMKANFLATLPKLKAAGERMPDPARGSQAGGNRGHIDPETRRQMLSATPQGRKILEAEAKAAKSA